jgi:hypothetical protein
MLFLNMVCLTVALACPFSFKMAHIDPPAAAFVIFPTFLNGKCLGLFTCVVDVTVLNWLYSEFPHPNTSPDWETAKTQSDLHASCTTRTPEGQSVNSVIRRTVLENNSTVSKNTEYALKMVGTGLAALTAYCYDL